MGTYKQNYKFLEKLWVRLVGADFSATKLAARARHDGGHDIDGLSDSDLIGLIEGRFSGDWDEVAFSFSELLCYYAAHVQLGIELTGEQIVSWTFSVLMIAEVDRHLDYPLMEVFGVVQHRLDVDEAMKLRRLIAAMQE